MTEAMVVAMRLKKLGGATYKQLAREYGLPKVTVYDAVRGATWEHVLHPPPIEKVHHGRFDESKGDQNKQA